MFLVDIVSDFFSYPVIAHRGASAYAPENTIAAFDLALACGCQWVEFDVVLSQDKEPFVFHDASLSRTTNGHGLIADVDSVYLNSLDAGNWFSKQFCGEKIPHFRDVLKWLIFANMYANIEIKPAPNQSEATAVVVLAQLQRYWPADYPLPLVSSFDIEALTVCRSLAPELPLGLLIDAWDGSWQKEAELLACTSIHACHRILTAERVKEMKDAGFAVLSYTVNRKGLAQKLLSWGVSAVFSDYPDLLIEE
ncbi:MAG: glycerophosphodiester phosphodiesterase [Gammaproteobacteria bacterium]|nr:glycerophosphodiester phosphodiesterase [Gammaproteobacteria bacterium]